MVGKNTDRMTPAWSRQLALVIDAPMWQGSVRALQRKTRFIEAAASYPDYDSLPPRLKALYDRAAAQTQSSAHA